MPGHSREKTTPKYNKYNKYRKIYILVNLRKLNMAIYKPVWLGDKIHTRLKMYASKNQITMKESIKKLLDEVEKEVE